MLGYHPKELWGKEMAEILYRNPARELEDSETIAEENPLLAALQTGEVVRHDNDKIWRRDGTRFPASTLVSPIVTRYGLRGAVVTFSDITLRKEAEIPA